MLNTELLHASKEWKRINIVSKKYTDRIFNTEDNDPALFIDVDKVGKDDVFFVDTINSESSKNHYPMIVFMETEDIDINASSSILIDKKNFPVGKIVKLSSNFLACLADALNNKLLEYKTEFYDFHFIDVTGNNYEIIRKFDELDVKTKEDNDKLVKYLIKEDISYREDPESLHVMEYLTSLSDKKSRVFTKMFHIYSKIYNKMIEYYS
jgi:hypothetical protein